LSARRDRRAWASQLILPAIFVMLALVVAQILQVEEEEPPLKLTTGMFIGTITGGRTFIENHIIPFSSSLDSRRTSEVSNAFNAALSPGDLMTPATGGHDYMISYLMDKNSELATTSFGAVSVEGEADAMNVTLFFKNRAYHSIPAMMNLYNKARLNLLDYGDTTTQAWSHPLPKTDALLEAEMTGRSQIMTDLTVAITVIMAMGFIPASFVVYLVNEKSSNSKHQQLLTRVSPFMYWLSSYCWDLINFLAPAFLCFALFLMFRVAAYSGDNTPAIFILILAYGACMTPFMYCLEPLFSVASTAYVTLICTNVFTGTVSVMATTVMDLYQSDDLPELKPINAFVKAVAPWFLPNYCLGRGFIEVATNHYTSYAAKEFGICATRDGPCIKNGLHWDVAGRFIFNLVVMSFVWFLLRLMIEWRVFSQLFGRLPKTVGVKSGVEDVSVTEEAERVSKEVAAGVKLGSQDRLIISNLSKSFMLGSRCGRGEAVHSVRGISVGVTGGECFGLLGVNGAGKTTTMRMVTGDIEADKGDIYLGGWSLKGNRDRARRHLGYCPQFDALPDKLTVRETLSYYARIRGVPARNVVSQVTEIIERMCLEAHQHRLCEHLSGGNKRKLSTALALIGDPDVVLLDEPSTGIDVGARRFLWDVLGGIRQRGHALVLTSHSMDECEVLCSRLTIMVSGEFRCLGSPVQLKGKYGGGYTLAIKAVPRAEASRQQLEDGKETELDPSAQISSFMASALPLAKLSEENVGLFRYRLGGGGAPTAEGREGREGDQQDVPLAEVFRKLEEASSKEGALHGCISDYTLSQTSLEEVFLHFSQMSAESA